VRGQMHLVNDAVRICAGCEVRQECRDYRVITGSDSGVWGGELFTRKDKSETDDS
jgi:hypothetical protein